MGIKYDGELYDYVYPYVKNKLVFDVGANIGEVTKKFINAGAKVVAIEPQDELTVGENYKGVHTIRNLCISDKVGEVVFHQCQKPKAVSTCFDGWKTRHSARRWVEMKQKCTTLDALIEEFGKPIYIKIDVEGYEHKVLAGLSYNIEFISIEFTEGFIENFINCMKHVERLGYKKLITIQKVKKKGIVNGRRRTIASYKVVDDFYDVKTLIEFFKLLPKNRQGDLLIKS
jgi:FkbM family methyltransferase